MKFIRNSDPKSTLRIGARAEIEDWFAKWAPNADYTIGSDFKVIVSGNLVLGNSQVTHLPEGLTVRGYLHLQGSQISSLPDKLFVGRHLDLSKTPIASLPEGLYVGSWLDLRQTQITRLPNKIYVGDTIASPGDQFKIPKRLKDKIIQYDV